MNRIAVISSSKDPAGINIRENLIELFGFGKTDLKFHGSDVFQLEINGKTVSLYLIETELVNSENIDEGIEADILVFASKHRSAAGTKSFAVHSIGNWGEANLGGKSKTLCYSHPLLVKEISLNFKKNCSKEGFEITMEATHHGPFVQKPAVFVEIGSSEEEWKDKENGKIAARTIMDAICNFNHKENKIAIGIGGTHYCSNFNKVSARPNICFSHICPKHNLKFLDDEMLKQAIEKTIGKIELAVLDWKGLGGEKERILNILKNANVPFERCDRLK